MTGTRICQKSCSLCAGALIGSPDNHPVSYFSAATCPAQENGTSHSTRRRKGASMTRANAKPSSPLYRLMRTTSSYELESSYSRRTSHFLTLLKASTHNWLQSGLGLSPFWKSAAATFLSSSDQGVKTSSFTSAL